jgi:hypothetical protein
LTASSGETVRIRAVGIVRHCSFQDDQQVYRIGLVFTLIDERDEKLVAEFVKGLAKGGA